MGDGGTVYEVELFDKSADVNLINDNTLNDDADLVYPILANDKIMFEVYAHYVAGAGGITAAMNGPAGFTSLHYSANLDVTGATKVTSNMAVAWDTTVSLAAASSGMIRIVGMVKNGVNAGNVIFRWCQNVANAANTSVYEDSMMRITRLI